MQICAGISTLLACRGDAVAELELNEACILEKTHGSECISDIHTGLLLTLNLLQISRTRVPKVLRRNTYSFHSSKLPSVVYEYQEQNSTLKSSCCNLSPAMLLLNLMWKVRCLWEEILIPSIFFIQKCKT